MKRIKLNSAKTKLKEVILGGQDGLVNVLGIILAVGTATQSIKFVLIAGLAAAFAESVSMGAVAYTSYKSAKDFYKKYLKKEKQEIITFPKAEKEEIKEIYRRKGFKGKLLNDIVNHITKNKKLWVETMMTEELRLFPDEYEKPLRTSFLVGFTALIGSFIPVFPFFFIATVKTALTASIIISVITLFITGVIKAKITIGNKIKQGLEMVFIGIGAALTGYIIGLLLGMI